ncbi:unnamed protein product [Ceratitis capitata]|uniref:(Mediterranean fruit fly) hypothetical protein n=1 Tax=Ceratitis capitata TaxID=7213 RepID=A0A811U608_CERCA|nr:unnamed protein product [Ceratitis capitata]
MLSQLFIILVVYVTVPQHTQPEVACHYEYHGMWHGCWSLTCELSCVAARDPKLREFGGVVWPVGAVTGSLSGILTSNVVTAAT